MTIIYRSPASEKEFSDYFCFRWKQLRKPLNLPIGSEQDEFEDQAFHMAAYEDETIIGVGRLHLEENKTARIRYMAVHDQYQNQGIGGQILKKLEEIAKNKQLKACWLYAREGAIKFYLKNGYKIDGEANSGLSIKHERMEKKVL